MRIVFFIVLTIFIIVLTMLSGIKFKVLFLYANKSKSAFYTLNHKLFTLMQGKVLLLEDGKISIITKKNKMMQKDVPKAQSKQIALNILSKIKLKKVDVYIDSGKKQTPLVTALVNGGIKSISGILSSVLRTKNIETNFILNESFEEEEFSIALDLNVKISALSLIISILKAKKEYKKEMSYETQRI